MHTSYPSNCSSRIKQEMKLLLILFFGIYFSESLWASKPIVKVYSGLCESASLKLEGSGMGFSFKDQNYILTSEHVVVHSNEKYCHKVYLPHSGELNADLVAVDWGRGTAILKLKKTGGEDSTSLAKLGENVWDTIDDWDRQQPQSGSRVNTKGFAHSHKNLLESSVGSILTTQSNRHFLARYGTVIEILGAHGEFGMSGGAVFDETQSHFLGMLSHQYLKLVAGNRTLIGEYENSSVENHILVIPSSDLKDWVQNVLEPSSHVYPLFLRDPISQLDGKDVVLASGLRFEAIKDNINCKESAESLLNFTRSSQSNSFFSDYLFFGGDPVGIGGLGGVRKGFVSIQISLSQNSPKTSWYLPSRNSWVEELRGHLYKRDKVDVAYLLHRNPQSGSLTKECVGSLSEFFRKLNSNQVNPITFIQKPYGEPKEDLLVRLVKHSNILNQQIETLLKLIKVDDTLEPRREVAKRLALEYLIELKTVSETLVGENWTFVEPYDFNRYMEELRNGASAAYLTSLDFDLSVRLRDELLNLKEILEQLRL